MKRKFILFFSLLIFIIFISVSSVNAQGAVLNFSPKTKTTFVGSTFDVDIILDTKNQYINAIQVDLRFPQDKIQIVEPFSGKSIIQIWTSPPDYSNIDGTLSLRGGIPNPGIKTSSGLIFKVKFRAKSPGEANLYFSGSSKILLNDGKGTELPISTVGGKYTIKIPPPKGPFVYSTTHPDQEKWYRDNNPIILWKEDTGVTDYSYVLTREPTTIPDNVSEGIKNSTYYENIESGFWYFHIKSKKAGNWGGVTTFLLRIDNQSPADFEIQCDTPRTSSPRPVISFLTTDVHSGVDYYEVKIINLSKPGEQEIYPFSEQISPYQLPKLEKGTYQVIVRAFDKAGNWKDGKIKIEIVSPWISFMGSRGISIRGVLIPWYLLLLLLIIISGIIIFLIYLGRKKDKEEEKRVKEGLGNMKEIIDNELLSLDKKLSENVATREKIQEKFEELEKLRSRYLSKEQR
ncbi:MAG: cohesin domain-containing protein [Candidatus Pacebacteria bacterium]|nr:cohesin domain-containing protein [Candidatus Paceibacterota bacterium]